MAKSKSSSPSLMSFVAMTGAAVSGAAMGAVAALMSDHKKRKSFEKTASKLFSQFSGSKPKSKR